MLERHGVWMWVVGGVLALLSAPVVLAQPVVRAQDGAVAADHPMASWAGAHVLERGGNAVDAAVATSFALSVVRPESCGIGGGGFMVIHLRDDPRTDAAGDPVNIAIDYRERAPGAITPDHFVDLPVAASTSSGHAVAIPGTVDGLLTALELFGTMDREAVLEPAIRLARGGWVIDEYQSVAMHALHAHVAERKDYGTTERQFVNALTFDGAALQNDLVRNPAKAVVLELIAERGRAGFYEGMVAGAIVETVRGFGGVMTLEDLSNVRTVVSEPIVRRIDGLGGRTIVTMPLPSSGGITLVQMLEMFAERFGGRLVPMEGNEGVVMTHWLIEIMKHAFADRATFLGDPEFVDVPVDVLMDGDLLRARAQRIGVRAFPVEAYGTYPEQPAELRDWRPDALEDGGTSHLSVIDRFGNAVSCTETVNLLFGSKLPVASFGFFLNNEMDDFATRPGEPNAFGLIQSDRNAPEAGKRPLSSMTPTIVLDADGDVEMVVGASGGPRIITSTFLTIVRAMSAPVEDFAAVVSSPRIHHQWLPDFVFVEQRKPTMQRAVWQLPVRRVVDDSQRLIEGYKDGKAAIDVDMAGNMYTVLRRFGHDLRPMFPSPASRPSSGVVQLIVVRDGVTYALSDPRKGGVAVGASREAIEANTAEEEAMSGEAVPAGR